MYTDDDKKRLKTEAEDYRGSFRRDCSRIIHSAAFRRLQGKTQLFPGNESDFFRNRLTHSLEVAQIGTSIVKFLNEKPELKEANLIINENIVNCAGLAHDLGHPPFGHNGEAALNECMKDAGGFEGNAQTLRILSKIEKKVIDEGFFCGITPDGKDVRFGLNLTFRTLASILKYDQEIKYEKPNDVELQKGYYSSESDIVREIKRHVIGNENFDNFKTIECYIMELADDIAYATHDLEDALKAEFITLFDLISIDEDQVKEILSESRELQKCKEKVTSKDITDTLQSMFADVFNKLSFNSLNDQVKSVVKVHEVSKMLSQSGYDRIAFTSELIKNFIKDIKFELGENPAMSIVELAPEKKHLIEFLKRFIYKKIINSPKVKIAEHRGADIVKTLFKDISKNTKLLPKDYKLLYENAKQDKRIICDFIAGMTDRYALEFYGRLYSENPESMFKPL